MSFNTIADLTVTNNEVTITGDINALPKGNTVSFEEKNGTQVVIIHRDDNHYRTYQDVQFTLKEGEKYIIGQVVVDGTPKNIIGIARNGQTQLKSPRGTDKPQAGNRDIEVRQNQIKCEEIRVQRLEEKVSVAKAAREELAEIMAKDTLLKTALESAEKEMEECTKMVEEAKQKLDLKEVEKTASTSTESIQKRDEMIPTVEEAIHVAEESKHELARAEEMHEAGKKMVEECETRADNPSKNELKIMSQDEYIEAALQAIDSFRIIEKELETAVANEKTATKKEEELLKKVRKIEMVIAKSEAEIRIFESGEAKENEARAEKRMQAQEQILATIKRKQLDADFIEAKKEETEKLQKIADKAIEGDKKLRTETGRRVKVETDKPAEVTTTETTDKAVSKQDSKRKRIKTRPCRTQYLADKAAKATKNRKGKPAEQAAA